MSDDLYRAFERPRMLLKWSGLWHEDIPSTSNRIRFAITITMSLLSASLMYTAMVFQTNVKNTTQVLAAGIPFTSCVIKIIIFKSKGKNFMVLFGQLQSEEFNSYPQYCRGIMDKYTRIVKRVSNIFQGGCVLIIIMYTLEPFVVHKNLLIPIAFDFGYFLPVVFILQVYGFVNSAYNESSVDVLAMGLTGICVAQIDILNRKIMKFRTSDPEESKNNLCHCVKYHCQIISFASTVESIFSEIILSQCAFSGLSIASMGVEMIRVNPISPQFAKMLLFISIMIGELSIYCWCGNEIIVKSTAIIDACYHSDWLNADTKCRRMLMIISERCKRPMFMTMGKISIISLRTLVSVLKMSYSYFTVLQTLYRKV